MKAETLASFDLVLDEVATSLLNRGSISQVVNSHHDCVKILRILFYLLRFRGALRPCIWQGQAWNTGVYL